MTPPPRASQSFERPRQYGPDPASAAAAYHIEENVHLCSRQPRQDSTFTSRPAPSRHRPSGNNQAGLDGRNTSEAWFDEVNTAVREPQLTTDGKTQNFNPPMPADGHARSDELPFNPQGGSFSSSDVSSKTNVPRRQVVNRTVATMAGNAPPTEKTDSNDFRSIIDDLTVENQALRERLSRAEAALAPPEVQQDRLFEVKVHGLPAHQKRELLETLTIFARKHDVLKEAQSSQHPGAGSSTHYASVNRSAQPYGGMINSSSHELLDSMHTSTSTSGQASTPAFDQKNESSKKMRKEEQPLQETPAGLLYKGYDPSMTDREKKIMIVKRLEQLFNGKRVSRSKPAKPGPALDGETGVEQITQQIREAQILPSIEESSTDDVAANVEAMVDGDGGSQHEADHEQSDVQRMPSPQRETRPLDLDPNRTQTAQENINYIRHLGMSPKLTAEENSDTDHILGWVPLNLLFNLAQLHIFYVTPDFVRSAITEISTRFELSKDRQMVRWQGGPVDTKSSDSEGDRVMREATTDSSDSGSKRRKMGGNSGTDTAGPGNNHGNSTTASSSNRLESARGRRRYDLDYKPLFSKNSKSSGRPYHHDDGASAYLPRSTVDGDAYGSAPGTMMTHETNYSHPRSDAGPIVFFSGAHFVTDLSGDPKDAIAQDPRFFQYGTKRVAITPLGAERPKRPRPKAIRSHSGSRIKVRPFKDYSKCAEKLQKDSRLKTPERICSDDANSNDISFDPKWTDDSKSASPQQRIVMEASGIGGTKPDDNFVVIVETAHPKMRSEFHKQLQAQVASALDPERRTAKLLHMIEEAKLDAAQLSKHRKGKQPARQTQEREKSPPVKITVLSKRELRLQPSETPPPAQLWEDDSDSDSDSDVSMLSSSTDQGIDQLKRSPPDTDAVLEEEESSGEEDEDDDEDESIDMMHVDRQQNPGFVAEREGTYERQLRLIAAGDNGRRRSASSNATAGDEEDETSDTEGEEGEGERDDSGDEDEDGSMEA